ncbi:MAG: hypothetical protein JSV58_01970 [Candidatus Bathyarchaeota archaeon]|nr:MAG: hypothetical protein JSV58_01970 [Candidatus Bathyarchaeota archaeon]
MAETESEDNSKIWTGFMKKHWNMVALAVIAGALAVVGAILVYLWFVGDAQSTGLVPTTLNFWTMGHIVTFLLHLIFWELLFIGVPVVLAAIAGWLWWRRLPEADKACMRMGTRSKATSEGGGGISLLVTIAFCFKIFLDGNWDVPISTWTFDYLVYSCLTALLWVSIIFGIPIGLGIIWWIHHEMTKKP